MAAIAVVVAHWYKKPQHAYRAALGTTAVIFGALHLPDISIAGLVIVLFNAGAGVLMGWMYWHWGVAHAILCHIAAGVIIQSFGPRIVM
jgi:membrane protease YdiL (CAAX protease family)